MDMRVAAYAVIERRGKLLLTHWRRGHLHGWTLPGGGLEAGEDPRDAVVREVFEETGLEARVGALVGVDSRVMVREEVPEGTAPELHTIRIVYRATVKDGQLRNEVDGSSDEARWVPIRDIKGLRTLSLVQTAMRMANIDSKNRGGARRATAGKQTKSAQGSKQGKPVQAKQAQGKPVTSKPQQKASRQQRSRRRVSSQQPQPTQAPEQKSTQ